MENIILDVLFYFLLAFLSFLIIAEKCAITNKNNIHEDFVSYQQIINPIPTSDEKTCPPYYKDKPLPNEKEFNIFKYIDDGLNQYTTKTIQEIYNSRSL
jgi:hypothetical protein